LQRVLTSAALVFLLVATAAAFAITERLKLTKSPLTGTKVSKVFSPTSGGARTKANVKVRLRRADTVTVSILDAREHEVAVLANGLHVPRGFVTFRWDGRLPGGSLAPDGGYRAKIHLANQHQTIVLPNVIRLDTKPPEIVSVTADPEEFSPDGDRQADFVRLRYALSKPARLTLFLGGRRIQLTYHHPQRGATSWNGRVGTRQLPPGAYTLQVGAVDAAGNSTPVADRARVHVRIRFIELAASRIVAGAGKVFEIGVSTDARRYRWQLGARKGRNGGAVLRLRAPSKRGTYTLTVTQRGHRDRARVVVK
jgi:hypothetical protein